MMNNEVLTVIVAGFIPTWCILAKMYKDIGRLEQSIKDMKLIVENGFKKKRGYRK